MRFSSDYSGSPNLTGLETLGLRHPGASVKLSLSERRIHWLKPGALRELIRTIALAKLSAGLALVVDPFGFSGVMHRVGGLSQSARLTLTLGI